MQEQRIRLYGAAALAALAAATGGCTDAGGSFFIVQNQIPGDRCLISPTAGDARPRGRIDVQASDGYLFTPVVESRVESTPATMNSRVIAVEGADVDVTFLDGLFSSSEESQLRDDRLTRFSQPFSGSVFPGSSSSFGFIILPAALLDRIADKLGDGDSTQVVADIVVFGQMNDGDVESDPFRYPVDVCNGCMLVDRGPCADLATGFEASPGGVCNLLQDVPLDCCSEGGAQVCPAEGS